MIAEHEFGALRARHPRAVVHARSDRSQTVVVPAIPLASGWNQTNTSIQFLVPIAYPAAQPDCFYTDAQLRLSDGEMPRNAALAELDGNQLLWFSWHLASWHPHRNDLVSYLRFIERRLSDAE